MQNVGRALEGEELATAPSAQGVSNEDPTYRLLVDCNQLSVDIDGEIAIVHNFMKVGPLHSVSHKHRFCLLQNVK